MKQTVRVFVVAVVSTLIGSTGGVLSAMALYKVFPALYREIHHLFPHIGDLGPDAGFEFFVIALGMLVVVSNVLASATAIAVWSFFRPTKHT